MQSKPFILHESLLSCDIKTREIFALNEDIYTSSLKNYLSKEDVTRYLQEEIERRNQSINQKLSTIEQLQREITADQQQITECNFVLGQLANEAEE